MTPCLTLLLAAALCASPAYSLLCFTCPSPTPSGECRDITNCSATQYVCKTVVYSGFVDFPFQGNESVVRTCSELCKPTDQSWLGITSPTFCCNVDLCNRNGISSDDDDLVRDLATSVKMNPLTMALLGIVLSALLRLGL